MICTIRIPDVLQVMIDSAAGEGKRSEWILAACRMRLDGYFVSERMQGVDCPECEDSTPHTHGRVAQPEERGTQGIPSPRVSGSNPGPSINIQSLRDVCAGKTLGYQPDPSGFVAKYRGASPDWLDSVREPNGYFVGFVPPEIPPCGKDWWEDGEHYECLMDKGHKEQKHGMRGMVRKVDN